jgi:hypothetical protein
MACGGWRVPIQHLVDDGHRPGVLIERQRDSGPVALDHAPADRCLCERQLDIDFGAVGVMTADIPLTALRFLCRLSPISMRKEVAISLT